MRASRASDGTAALKYRLTGSIGRLRIPPPRPAQFVDGLWEHTCFEAFLAADASDAYREYNFSPSGEWATYAFTTYRQREEIVATAHAPKISVHQRADLLELDVLIPTALLPRAAAHAELRAGLAAVIEAADGTRSYWALAHPGARPDFHHRGGFMLVLAPHAIGKREQA